MGGPVLIGYDASENARHAIAVAAGVLGRGRSAVVVHVWRPYEHAAAARFSLPARAGILDDAIEELDSLAAKHAHGVADEGRALAADAGFDAAARAERAERRPGLETGAGAVWHAILEVAQELDAAAIVVGTRGLSAPRALILGSISSGLLHHAHVPVLVVPAPE